MINRLRRMNRRNRIVAGLSRHVGSVAKNTSDGNGVLLAVEKVMQIHAKRIAEFNRTFGISQETFEFIAEYNALSNPVPHSRKYSTRNNASRGRTREKGKKVILKGQSSFSFQPMRPRISLKGLNVYVRSRIGGREEPGRRFEKNKEARRGGRMSLRRMPLIDFGFHDYDNIEFDLHNYDSAEFDSYENEGAELVPAMM